MHPILKDRSFRFAILLTLIFLGFGLAFLLTGFAELNLILFAVLPVLLGLSIGALPNKRWALIGVLLTVPFFLYGLLVAGIAGFICIIYSIPLILPLIFLGSVVTHLIDRYKKIKTEKLSILLTPLLPFLIVAPLDTYFNRSGQLFIEVKTERVYNYTPEQVYDAIKSVDTLDAEKPFLMHLDLPVPTKCILEKEEVGGLRTCYFDGGNLSRFEYGGGTITERITELERGRILKMDVIDYQLIGRNWLGFKDAIYHFEKAGENGCRLTRITTYTSVLKPRFYWEPLEKLGIEQEHEYVLNNLEKDLGEEY